ncbi:hypothetical protein HYU92_00710 [Candidatus Curtissbacteria bacterium]|nr:hypothetical protein [Candidatus Curtissbacteria bacterium]
MDQITKDKTLEKITKAENILIAVFQDTGIDGLAAGLALYLSCQKLSKNVSIIGKSPTVKDGTLLYGVDKIGQSQGTANLAVVVQDAVESVDKVTYFLEENKLKIVIHPFPGSKGLSQDKISFEQVPAKPDLIFAIGFKSSEDLIKVITREQNLDSSTYIVNVSVEQVNQKFAQINFSNPESASVCEVTAQFIQDLALPVDEDIAYNLFTGISQSTESFSPAKCTQNSFQIAAWLIKFGAGRASLASESKSASIPKQSSQQFTPPTPNPVITSQSVYNFQNQSNLQNALQTPISQNDDKMPQVPFDITPLEEVERQKTSEKDWLKPPKIYRGSKSFDREN